MAALTPHQARAAMLSIGGGVGVLAAASPDTLLRLFGTSEPLTPEGRLGWRLFAARNVYLTARALQGQVEAENAYGPLQVLDQAVFWSALLQGHLPRRTSALAIGASATIIALDRVRKKG